MTQQFFEYVDDTNREKVHNRRIAYAYLFPILDPQGSRDQFYYNIEKHYGASDHAVFIAEGIPAAKRATAGQRPPTSDEVASRIKDACAPRPQPIAIRYNMEWKLAPGNHHGIIIFYERTAFSTEQIYQLCAAPRASLPGRAHG